MFHFKPVSKKALKLLCFFLNLILFFSLNLNGSAVFAGEITDPPADSLFHLEVSSAKAVPGESIDIIVSMQNNPGFSGFDFDLSFNNLGSTANLKPVSITPLNDFATGIFSSNLDELNAGANIDWNTQDTISITWSDADNMIAGEDDLFKIRFDIGQDAESGVYELDLNGRAVNELYEVLEYGSTPGSIEVVVEEGEEPIDFLYGDTYYDEEVEIKDATRLSQFLVSKVSLSAYELLAANVNYDLIDDEGRINVKDAIKLSQWLADYEGIVLGDGPDGRGAGRRPGID